MVRFMKDGVGCCDGCMYYLEIVLFYIHSTNRPLSYSNNN